MAFDGIRPDGAAIRQHREQRGWTQKDLARKAGCAPRTIENAEAGKRILPRILFDICQVLGVSIKELLLPRDVGSPHVADKSSPGSTTSDIQDRAKQTDPAIELESDVSNQGAGSQFPSIGSSIAATPVRAALDPGAAIQAPRPSKRTLLVVDDKGYVSAGIIATLQDEYIIFTATSADEAERLFEQHPIDIILTDQKMPGRLGVELLEWVRSNSPRTVRLLMTAFAEYDDLVDAINRGKIYYLLCKPWQSEELRMTLRNAAEKFDLERRYEQLFLELCDLNQELEQRVALRTRELQQANAELQVRTREMERLALSDPLTGLSNRRYIDGLGRAEAKRHARYGNPWALGLYDVDNFKQINTAHLHAGGDATLVGLAQILVGLLRETDAVGRMAGDEFLVIARQTDLEGARTLGERICTMVAQTPIDCLGRKIGITLSGGFAVAAASVTTTYEDLYKLACSALHDAKIMGGNRCVVRTIESPLA
jgi:diguanylate cyclase (GGDEF)-like protein